MFGSDQQSGEMMLCIKYNWVSVFIGESSLLLMSSNSQESIVINDWAEG